MPTTKRSSSKHQALDRFMRKQMARTGVPGVAVGVVHKGRQYVKGYGVTNVDNPLAVEADTLFQIGSTTKTFTATAIMRLVDRGLLDLEAPVRRYLPDLRLRDGKVTRNVTILHLLTHTGGWLGDYFEDTGRGDDALAKVIAKMSKLRQLTPLGEVWSYNNSGFYIAGRVIEKITKKPYETAIRELLLDPLEMSNSYFFAEEVMAYRFAVGHITHRTKSRVATPWHLPRTSNPAGGIISNVKDQLKWARFHMGDGHAPNGKRLLRKSTLRLMQKPHAQAGSMADAVGISWLLRTIDGVSIVRHGGTTYGQLSSFLMAPEEDFAITVLTNSSRGGELHTSVVNWALGHYLGLDLSEEPPIEMTRRELLPYAGKYRVESSQTIFEVVLRNAQLVIKFPEFKAGADGKKPPPTPPVPLHFYAKDRVAGSSGPMKGTRAEFVRAPAGRIAWFRVGGRIHRRLPDKPASKKKSRAR